MQTNWQNETRTALHDIKQNPPHMWKGNPHDISSNIPFTTLWCFSYCNSVSILQYLERVPLFSPQFFSQPVTNFPGQAAFAQKFGKRNTQQSVKSRQFFQTKWQENSCFTGLSVWIAIPVHGAESQKYCTKLHAYKLCAVRITTVMYKSFLPSASVSP